jgi:hypothetical protein
VPLGRHPADGVPDGLEAFAPADLAPPPDVESAA